MRHIQTASNYKILNEVLHFAYSSHKNRDRAESALDNYFASDIVSEGERPRVEPNGPVFSVWLPIEG